MALSAATVWEVRLTNGSDSNGGGFVAGASGTDYSQQNAAQFSGTDLASVSSLVVSSLTHNFVATDVGNLIQIVSGTGFTPGIYQIVSVSANQATLDRSPGTVGVSGVWAEGGALKTINTLATAFVASNTAFIKAESGTTTTTTITFAAASVSPSASVPPSRLIGYTTTRRDGGQATLTLSTNTGLTGLSFTNNGWEVHNIAINGASLGTSTGLAFNGSNGIVNNCKFSNTTTRGVNIVGGFGMAHRCEFTGCSGTCALRLGSAGFITECNIHDNTTVGIISAVVNSTIIGNLITNNTGATSDGIQCVSGTVIYENTIHGNGRHGISNTGTNAVADYWKNNSISNNGGYGAQGASSAGRPATPWFDGNAFGYPANTSGTRNNMDDTSTNPIDGVSPYTNTFDVTITVGTQYVSAGTGATGNWALNGITNQGALIDYAGQPTTWPGNSATTGYSSIGAAQYKATPPIGQTLVIKAGAGVS